MEFSLLNLLFQIAFLRETIASDNTNSTDPSKLPTPRKLLLEPMRSVMSPPLELRAHCAKSLKSSAKASWDAASSGCCAGCVFILISRAFLAKGRASESRFIDFSKPARFM